MKLLKPFWSFAAAIFMGLSIYPLYKHDYARVAAAVAMATFCKVSTHDTEEHP